LCIFFRLFKGTHEKGNRGKKIRKKEEKLERKSLRVKRVKNTVCLTGAKARG
jgi:hypothetical protein